MLNCASLLLAFWQFETCSLSFVYPFPMSFNWGLERWQKHISVLLSPEEAFFNYLNIWQLAFPVDIFCWSFLWVWAQLLTIFSKFCHNMKAMLFLLQHTDQIGRLNCACFLYPNSRNKENFFLFIFLDTLVVINGTESLFVFMWHAKLHLHMQWLILLQPTTWTKGAWSCQPVQTLTLCV